MIGFNAGGGDWNKERFNRIKGLIKGEIEYGYGLDSRITLLDYRMLINKINDLEITGQAMADHIGPDTKSRKHNLVHKEMAIACKEDWESLMKDPNYLEKL